MWHPYQPSRHTCVEHNIYHKQLANKHFQGVNRCQTWPWTPFTINTPTSRLWTWLDSHPIRVSKYITIIVVRRIWLLLTYLRTRRGKKRRWLHVPPCYLSSQKLLDQHVKFMVMIGHDPHHVCGCKVKPPSSRLLWQTTDATPKHTHSSIPLWPPHQGNERTHQWPP